MNTPSWSRPATADRGPSVTQIALPLSLCLPWIILGQGIAQNTVIEHNISFIDVAPTLAHILDVFPHPNWQGSRVQDFFTQGNKLQQSVENQTYMHLFKEQQMRPAA